MDKNVEIAIMAVSLAIVSLVIAGVVYLAGLNTELKWEDKDSQVVSCDGQLYKLVPVSKEYKTEDRK
jgi:hypothetical protein